MMPYNSQSCNYIIYICACILILSHINKNKFYIADVFYSVKLSYSDSWYLKIKNNFKTLKLTCYFFKFIFSIQKSARQKHSLLFHKKPRHNERINKKEMAKQKCVRQSDKKQTELPITARSTVMKRSTNKRINDLVSVHKSHKYNASTVKANPRQHKLCNLKIFTISLLRYKRFLRI